ncbi:IS4 family transposase [Nonomuraea sp. LP-02]|uniref:IS4 family transposase n=1 Tax=Nonomuraea sp. LP-02 TaxID=3097960 RepID=UPI002E34F974|nr:IS4 family transposase [Nonomuraea sp. LP-02]MED7930423.1 IS4 family transposase [Nonomuraea sp. LP-02]
MGELTALVPFEIVAAILEETRNVQRRLRGLPSRVGVYFLLAMCLFPEVGYLLVWQKLTASLTALPVLAPTAKALRDLRRRVGSAPMQRLFEVLSGPLAQPRTPGARFGVYRTVSLDSCSSLKAPDTVRNRAWLGSPGHGGYPLLELMTLVETRTRALIGVVFGPTGEGESAYARRLLQLLKPNMLVLWDKGFDGNVFLAQVSATGAQFLGRLRSNRRTPILAPLTDGSYLSMIGTLQIRIIEARVTVTCADGTTFAGTYRLATTLTNARRYPAAALISLYHQRWEHESAYYALRHTVMQGRRLRSGDPAGLEQQMWSILTLYQLLRTVVVDAAESRPGTDPDRCGFSIALHAPRDLVIRPGDNSGYATGLVGVVGRRVLAALLPPPARESAPARSNRLSPVTTNAYSGRGAQRAARLADRQCCNDSLNPSCASLSV